MPMPMAPVATPAMAFVCGYFALIIVCHSLAQKSSNLWV
jgi:hypothetical protein